MWGSPVPSLNIGHGGAVSGASWQEAGVICKSDVSDFLVSPKPSPTWEGQPRGLSLRLGSAPKQCSGGKRWLPATSRREPWVIPPRQNSEKWEDPSNLDPNSTGIGCHLGSKNTRWNDQKVQFQLLKTFQSPELVGPGWTTLQCKPFTAAAFKGFCSHTLK